MSDLDKTRDETLEFEQQADRPVPGVILAFSGTVPRLAAIPLPGASLRIGREESIGVLTADDRLSRHHAEVIRADGAWVVADLDSRNGTFVDGKPVQSRVRVAAGALVRMGRTLLLLSDDVRPFERRLVVERDAVLGPRFGAVLEGIAAEAAKGAPLLIEGETGTGKELAARAAHRAGPGAKGPFVAVNCATIPEGLAERLLFGTKRGAYSGAMGDVGGYLHSAEGGMLFLDEIGELETPVQAKLLRVLETKEFTPLGSPKPVRTSASFCSATHRDLRTDVASGRFRADLFYRLGQHPSRLPPLRERVEEIPWLMAESLKGGPDLHVKLVELCMLRPWPGNVRELLRESGLARQRAEKAKAPLIGSEHLGPSAGVALPTDRTLAAERDFTIERRVEGAPESPVSDPVSRDEIEAVLHRERGNVSAAARSLGLHRTQLRRILARLGPRLRKA